MRIFMQTRPTPERGPRFYHLFLQEDLINGWTLVSETGRQGYSGKVIKQHFNNWDEALESLINTRDAQLKRGYRVVFLQGQESPPTDNSKL